MKEMVVCPNCKRVTTKEKIIIVKNIDDTDKMGLLDKISSLLYVNKPVYRCVDCLNSE